MNAPWVFEARQKRMKKRDPMEAEFFTGEEDDDEVSGRTDSLVREAIQNSLDARSLHGGDVVRVRLAIGEKPLSPAIATSYLDGLLPHLRALRNEAVAGDPIPPLGYLVVEDFGTRGLCGDPLRRDDPGRAADDSDPQDFYWFWWNVGRSGKHGTDRGRWGVGKTIFPACSRVNAMFALTVQANSGRRLLMGQAVLKIHSVGGSEYEPDGCYCDPDRSSDLQVPFEDATTLARFERDFRLARGNEPGTSVVIPYPLETLSATALLRSVVVHYFVPIVRGSLVVEVEGPGIQPTTVDRGSIEEIAGALRWDGRRAEKKHAAPPVRLARFAAERQREGTIPELKAQSMAPVWSQSLVEDCDLTALRAGLALGGPVAVRVPIDVVLNNRHMRDLAAAGEVAIARRSSRFDVFIERDPAGKERGEDYFVRGGMTISGISTIAGTRGVRALVLVDDEALAGFLGDAEGPAHTDWKEGEEALKRKYDTYPSRLRFVRNSVSRLIEILTPPPAGLDRTLLQDFFSVDLLDSGPRKKKGTKTAPPPPPPPPAPKPYEIRALRAGFSVRGRSGAGPMPAALRVRAAFDVEGAKGKRALALYSPLDFRFDAGAGLDLTASGCTVASRSQNEIELRELVPDFELTVTGFPEHLDVIVFATPLTVASAGDDQVDAGPSGPGDSAPNREFAA